LQRGSAEEEEKHAHARPRSRPEELSGKTTKIVTGCGSLYVTVNGDESGAPFELFAEIGKAGGCAASQCQGLGRLASLALRSGIEPREVVRQLRGISCHSPAGLGPSKILSCSDAIGRALSHYIGSADEPHGEPIAVQGACPDCGSVLDHSEGCVSCKICGYSKCG
jgi:ribonucleoside-diphosphate reductase alpha chain